jgi:hypothetical protein
MVLWDTQGNKKEKSGVTNENRTAKVRRSSSDEHPPLVRQKADNSFATKQDKSICC